MRALYNNNDIVIKPADKGGSIVIMNTTDYISEADRQLNIPDHYKRLLEDPTHKFNTHINNLINQAWRLNIVDESTYNNLQTKNPRIPIFYLLPKIHKKDNPGRPIVNGMGSVTEKISDYVDTFLRKYTPRIPSYIKDTTHFLNILKHSEDPKHGFIGYYRCQVLVYQHTSYRRHNSHNKDDRRHRIGHPI